MIVILDFIHIYQFRKGSWFDATDTSLFSRCSYYFRIDSVEFVPLRERCCTRRCQTVSASELCYQRAEFWAVLPAKKGLIETVHKVRDSDETKVIKNRRGQEVVRTLSSTVE